MPTKLKIVLPVTHDSEAVLDIDDTEGITSVTNTSQHVSGLSDRRDIDVSQNNDHLETAIPEIIEERSSLSRNTSWADYRGLQQHRKNLNSKHREKIDNNQNNKTPRDKTSQRLLEQRSFREQLKEEKIPLQQSLHQIPNGNFPRTHFVIVNSDIKRGRPSTAARKSKEQQVCHDEVNTV